MTNTAEIIQFKPSPYKIKEQSTSQTSIDFLSQDESTGSGDKLYSHRQLQGLIRKLNTVFTEAKCRNWNGENAEPISDATYYNAIKLISALPTNLPLPEILPDNDGYIEFEWHKHGKSFSLYVTDTNLVLYAGYYGKENRLSGRFNYEGDFPVHTDLLARNVYK